MWGRTVLRGADSSLVDPLEYTVDGEGRVVEALVRTATFVVVMSDLNGNAPPIGTTLTVEVAQGLTVNGPSDCEVNNQTEYAVCVFSVSNGDVTP